jgi:hypothetical protein
VWNESAFWITHYQGFLESFLARRGWPLAKPLSYPLSAATFVAERITKLGTLRAGDVAIEARPTFDDRFDDFWTELKGRSRHLLLATRTHEVLQWHFKYALVNNRLWIATVVDGPRMVAYAIFDRRDRADVGLRRVRLVDYQSLDGSTTLLSPLIGWALEKCREERIHMLEHFGRWLERGEVIDRLAPYRRTLPAWRYVYRASDAGLAERLSDPHAWAPSLFDGDASLVR